jgi:hypothetical protein
MHRFFLRVHLTALQSDHEARTSDSKIYGGPSGFKVITSAGNPFTNAGNPEIIFSSSRLSVICPNGYTVLLSIRRHRQNCVPK